ncbi:MAG TPA: NUMOD4 motif-containing HNH endonuclease [Spirochaetia bacterium]|nr:NUMOD4 motif-containing HNH endonuclease [Spirochaetia bacterium]
MNLSLFSEEWKPIKGFEGLYEISEWGNVRSLDHYTPNILTGGTSLSAGQALAPWIEKGYFRVGLSRESYHRFTYVHVLVGKAFLEPVKGKKYINHKDGNRLNNHKSNLEWCTQKENVHHAKYVLNRIGGNYKIVIDLNTGIFYNSAKEAHTAKGFLHSLSSTVHQLNGRCTNKTTLKYL